MIPQFHVILKLVGLLSVFYIVLTLISRIPEVCTVKTLLLLSSPVTVSIDLKIKENDNNKKKNNDKLRETSKFGEFISPAEVALVCLKFILSFIKFSCY